MGTFFIHSRKFIATVNIKTEFCWNSIKKFNLIFQGYIYFKLNSFIIYFTYNMSSCIIIFIVNAYWFMELPIPLHKCFFKSVSKDPEILTAFAHCQKRNGEEKCVRDIIAGVDFTNILRIDLSYKRFTRSFFVQVALVIRGLFICGSKKVYQKSEFADFLSKFAVFWRSVSTANEGRLYIGVRGHSKNT